MSQRFEGRRPKGAGGGKPGRSGGPRPDWRGAAPERESGGGRGDDSRGPRRDRFQRPQGTGRPTRVIGARPGEDSRTGERRPAGERRFIERRGGERSARRPDSRREDSRRDDGRFGRPQFGKPRFGAGRFAPRQDTVPAPPPAPAPAPEGSAERFGAEPADDLIWGRHSAQAALESDRPIHRIWCTPELRFAPRFLQLLRDAKAGGVLVEEVTWARLGQLTGGAVHQGIVLQAAAADTLDLGSLIEGCRALEEPPLLMAVDGLTDPHNLGAIVRSAEALGAHGLVLPQRRSAGLTGSVAKVAAGALEHLPVAKVVNLNRSLEQLKEEGYRVVGLAEEGTVSLIEADLSGPLVVVTGSEGQGLSMLTRRHCDQLIRIPLRGATPSLNASVATALLLYEIARRGWMSTITGSAPAPRIVRPQMATTAAPATEASQEPVAPEQEPAVEEVVQGLDAAAEVELPPIPAPPLPLAFLPATPSHFQGDIEL